MSDWISWIKTQSSDIVDAVKKETVELSGSLVESVKEIADKASKAVEALDQNDEDDNQEPDNQSNVVKEQKKEPDVSMIERLDLIAADTEDYIDSLATNISSKIGVFLSKAITIIPDKPDITLVSDRRSNLLLEMQKNPDTYATDYSFVTDEAQIKRFQEFSGALSLKDRQKEIDFLLEDVGVIKDFFRRMVPDPLDYDTFWTRYFFKVSEIDFQENARSNALKGNQGDVIWDDSDEEAPDDAIDENVKVQNAQGAECAENSIDAQDSKTVIETCKDVEKKDDSGCEKSDLVPAENDDIAESCKNNTVSYEQDNANANEEIKSAASIDDSKEKLDNIGEVTYTEKDTNMDSESSFDIVRNESTQPLQISVDGTKKLTSDDDWDGWDDSPDSPTV